MYYCASRFFVHNKSTAFLNFHANQICSYYRDLVLIAAAIDIDRYVRYQEEKRPLLTIAFFFFAISCVVFRL